MSETTDDYEKVIAILGERHRVVECKDSIQWILQKRTGGSGQFPWRALHYCRTKNALIRLSAKVDQAARAKLDHLPGHFRLFSEIRAQILREMLQEDERAGAL